MAKKNPFVSELERAAKRLAKAKPQKAYEILHEAFLVLAAAGDVEHAGAVIRLAYRDALPNKLTHVLGTGPMDAFCAAANLGDLTEGQPIATHLRAGMTLAQRVDASAARVRDDLTRDSYTQFPPPTASWTELSGRELYRKAQLLARPLVYGELAPTESEALSAMTKYMDAWCETPSDRGAGHGREVALALDLAIRHGATDRIARWLVPLGPHLLKSGIRGALCLPAVAKEIVSGLLAPLIAIRPEQTKSVYLALEDAVQRMSTSAAAPKPNQRIRRTIHTEYSQFHLEHASASPDEAYFQDERESAQGFSLFRTKVGIATPSETGECAVELALAKGTPPEKEIARAVQVIAFPFVVMGPLFVRSVSGGSDDEDDEAILPHGAYDVLVRFVPKKAGKEDARAGLRAFNVMLDFYPAGALDAPKCLKLAHGAPPTMIFVHE